MRFIKIKTKKMGDNMDRLLKKSREVADSEGDLRDKLIKAIGWSSTKKFESLAGETFEEICDSVRGGARRI